MTGSCESTAQYFDLVAEGSSRVLRCRLSGDVLTFDQDLRLVAAASNADPPYASALDALVCQVQEDFAVLRIERGRHWLAAVHLCFPNGWAAEEKIGRSFAIAHAPVAGMESMNAREDEFASVMVHATAGLERFAWGVTPDDRLDRHPADAATWARFDPARPTAFVRVERQTVWGFPRAGAALFTIRTYLLDVAEVRENPPERADLAAAVRGMSAESLAYKGLAPWRDGLLRWIDPADGAG